MNVETRINTLPTRLGQAVRHIEPHPKTSLSDIILGGQDGLVNVLGVVLGVAAASNDLRLVVVAGLAAAFAESISMGAVAYTTTLADRDFYLSEIEREKREIRDLPDLERQEIETIFAGWGFRGDLLRQSVEQVMKDERAWVDVMIHNELKLSPVASSTALRSAFVVGVSAIVGSLIPLMPFSSCRSRRASSPRSCWRLPRCSGPGCTKRGQRSAIQARVACRWPSSASFRRWPDTW